MSKARAKGTGWETELVPLLRSVFGPQVERAPLKGAADHGDFTGVPWLVEAKKTETPRFLEWARTARKKTGDRWMVVWCGDRRKGEGPYVLMPMGLVFELLGDYHELLGDYQEQRGRLDRVLGTLHAEVTP